MPASSASAQTTTRVGTVTSDSDNGKYVVSWAARGGCDASLNGSVSGTVTTGSAQLLGAYALSSDCNYKWTAIFTQPNGNQCTATVSGGTAGTPAVTVSVDTTRCISLAAAGAHTISVVGEDDNEGAVKATTWTVVATPTDREANPDDCSTKSFSTELKSDQQKADLKDLILTGINAANCEYNISVELKPGFKAETSGSNVYKGWESDDGDQTLKLAVAVREVFVVQNVTGKVPDPAAQVVYSKTVSCSADSAGLDLPAEISTQTPSSGLTVIPERTLVPFQTGRVDVTVALSSQTSSGGRAVISQVAIDDKGNPCILSVSLAEVPEGCDVDSMSKRANLPNARQQSLLEFVFICTAPQLTTTTAAPTTTAAVTTTVQPAAPAAESEQTMSSSDLPPVATTTTAPPPTTTTAPPSTPTTATQRPTGPPQDRPTG